MEEGPNHDTVFQRTNEQNSDYSTVGIYMVKGLRSQNKTKQLKKRVVSKGKYEGRQANNFGGIGKANFKVKALRKNHWHGNGKQILIK